MLGMTRLQDVVTAALGCAHAYVHAAQVTIAPHHPSSAIQVQAGGPPCLHTCLVDVWHAGGNMHV
jgi:hypothetical protein